MLFNRGKTAIGIRVYSFIKKKAIVSIGRKLCLFCISFLFACSSQESAEESKLNVMSYGSRLTLIEQGQLEGVVSLDTITKKRDFYALGPVAGLQGEITVYDNDISIAKVKDGKPQTNNSLNTEAIFLITAEARQWEEFKVGQPLSGLTAVEEYVRDLLIKSGQDTAKATVFRIEGQVEELEYHIIWKTDDLPHNMAAHKKAKVKYQLQDEAVKIVGFWVDKQREGKFTHPGKRTHLHFIGVDSETSGHIDGILLPKGARIFLPK